MKLYRILKLAFQSFARNRLLSLASTLIMALTLLTISIIMMLNFFSDEFIVSINKRIDVEVYLKDTASNAEIDRLKANLLERPDVAEVQFISKDEALSIWRDQMKDNKQLMDIINEKDNPLPASFKVKAKDPQNIPDIVSFVKGSRYTDLIHRISYDENKSIIERILNITKNTKRIGWILSGLFVVVSILIVYNSTRITIFTRKEEIEIMRLVGATGSFVTWPFIIEGLLYGLIAAASAVILLGFALYFASPAIYQYTRFDVMSTFFGHLWTVTGTAMLVGGILSIVTSGFAVRKYLKI